MEKEIHSKLTEESFGNISSLDKKIITNKLLFRYKGNIVDQNFSRFDNVLDLIDKTKEGKISLTEAKDEQARLKSDMGDIKGAQKHLLRESGEAGTNIENLYKARKPAIDF